MINVEASIDEAAGQSTYLPTLKTTRTQTQYAATSLITIMTYSQF